MMYVTDRHRVESYGQYRLTALRTPYGYDTVTMYDLGNLHFPLMWSTHLTEEETVGAIELFKAIGYFEMPIHVT